MKPQWEKVIEQAAFSPRDTAEGVVFQGKMWLSNGYFHGNQLSRDLWSSENGVDWTLVHSETPYDGYSEMVVFEDKMWAIKGSVWNSIDGEEWHQVLEKTPFGVRGYGEVVVHQGKIWQLGSGSDVWSSTDGVRWERVLENAPYGERTAAGVTVHDGKIWLMGGYLQQPNDPPEKGYEKFTTFNDVWNSEDGVKWERVIESAPWSPRMWFGCDVFEERIWMLGGYSNREEINLGDVWSSEDGVHWREEPAGFSPRHEPTVYDFRDCLWLIAGNEWPVLNDVWRWRLSTKTQEGSARLPTGEEILSLPGLENVMRVSGRIYSGGEPLKAQGLETLKELGVRTVVSVDGAKPRAERARELGMRYVHIPIGYDGIGDKAGRTIARLVQEASTPLYIHCHHGQHRGPAAAAIAYIVSTSCDGADALRFLERGGTSREYSGLWRDVESFQPPSPDQALPPLVEISEVSSLAEAMAQIDRHFDHLKLLQEVDWQFLADHPDLDPIQEAILLTEALHESHRKMSGEPGRDSAIQEWMQRSESRAQELKSALKAGESSMANRSLERLKVSCDGCHKEFRN